MGEVRCIRHDEDMTKVDERVDEGMTMSKPYDHHTEENIA